MQTEHSERLQCSDSYQEWRQNTSHVTVLVGECTFGVGGLKGDTVFLVIDKITIKPESSMELQ